MSAWDVKRTDTFLQEFKKYKKNADFVDALDRKIKRLRENPYNIGGFLSGPLSGKKSTRILRKFRLIFSLDDKQKIVYLEAIDHRGSVYD